jgi:hypothetical protein
VFSVVYLLSSVFYSGNAVREAPRRLERDHVEGFVSLAQRTEARYAQGSTFDNCQGITAMPTTTISPRRKLRLSLRLVMVMIVVAAIPLARLAVRARAQKAAVLAISNAGGFIGYDWQFLPDGRRNPSPKPPDQWWIQKWLGPDYFQTVELVNLQRDDNGDDVMEHVGKLDGLRKISITGTEITDAGIAHLAALSRLPLVYFQ